MTLVAGRAFFTGDGGQGVEGRTGAEDMETARGDVNFQTLAKKGRQQGVGRV